MCIRMDQENARTLRVPFLQQDPITARSYCGPARTTQLKHVFILILSYRLLLYTSMYDRIGFRELLLMTAEERGRKQSVCSHWLQLVPSFPTHLHSTCYLACQISSGCQQHCDELSLSPLDCVFEQAHTCQLSFLGVHGDQPLSVDFRKPSPTAKSGLKSRSVILG